MTDLSPLKNRFAETLGWTLVHSAWELALLALVGALLLALLRRSSANARYAAACAAFLLMAAAPIGTFVHLLPPAPVARPLAATITISALPMMPMEQAPTAAPLPIPLPPESPLTIPLAARLDRAIRPCLPAAVLCYLAGVFLVALRWAAGYSRLRRLTSASGNVTAIHGRTRHMLDTLAAQMGITRALRLLECPRIEVPTLIGALRPAILLPVSALTGLSPDQLAALLAHELAHIRRHDYLANLLQSILETLLFYHPAVWWLSARIRQERENCCDDAAIAITGDRLAYARALASMETLRAAPPRVPASLALAARGGGGTLLPRIRRLLGMPDAPRGPRAYLTIPAALLMLLMLSGLIYVGCSKSGESGTSPSTSAPASEPAKELVAVSPTPASAAMTGTLADRFDRTSVPHFRVEGISLEKAISQLADAAGIRLTPNWEVLRSMSIDPNKEVLAISQDETAYTILTNMLLQAGGSKADIAYSMDQGAVTISSWAAIAMKDADLPSDQFQKVRVYDIRDMLPMSTGPGSDRNRTDLVNSISQTIQATVAPASWRDAGGAVGSIRELNCQLIVNQTVDNQVKVRNLLAQLRETRALRIAVESRMLLVPSNFLDDFRVGWDINVPARVAGKPDALTATAPATQPGANLSASIIDNWTLNLLMNAAQADKRTVAVTAPRATLFNGQQGSISISSRQDPAPAGGDNAPAVGPAMKLDLAATVSADRRYVVMTLHPEVTLPDGGAEMQRGITSTPAPDANSPPKTISAESMVSIPDGGTLLLGGKADASHYLLVLVRPNIVIHPAIDPAIIGPGGNQPTALPATPASATATTPAPTAPPANQAALPAVPLAPGDTLTVEVFGVVTPGETWVGQVTVDVNGNITLPKITKVAAAGLTTVELAGKISKSIWGMRVGLSSGTVPPDPEVKVTRQSPTTTASATATTPAPTAPPANQTAPPPAPGATANIGQPDGIIRLANTAAGEVYITLTKKDGITPGMTFTVYDPRSDTGGATRINGMIEVQEVGETASLCHITQTTNGHTIQTGDLIANLIYHNSKTRGVHVAVIGNFDLDGDGVASAAERERLIAMINGWGGQVDETLTEHTDFLVAGTRPLTLEKEQMQYDASITAAKRFTTPVFSGDRFFSMIGQPSQPTTTQVTATPAGSHPAATATQPEKLAPGDALTIEIFELIKPGVWSSQAASVDADGNVAVNNIAKIHAAGLTSEQFADKIGQTAIDQTTHGSIGGGGKAGTPLTPPQVKVTRQSRAPAANAAPKTIIAPGDYLRISAYELVTPALMYQRTAFIDPDGNFWLMNLGKVHAAGMKLTELEATIGQLAVEKGVLLPKGNGNPGPQVEVERLTPPTDISRPAPGPADIGDTLDVSVFELETPGKMYTKQATVNEDGDITLINLGKVQVKGLTAMQVEEKIAKLAVDIGFLLPKGNGQPGPQVAVLRYAKRQAVPPAIPASQPAPTNPSASGPETLRQKTGLFESQVPYADLMVYSANPPGLARAQDVARADAIRTAREKLDGSLKEFSADQQGLEKVLNFLRDTMGANIFINWPALQAAGIDRNTPITITLKDTTFRKTLTTILSQVSGPKANPTFTIDDGIILISTKEDLTSQKYQLVRVFDVRDLISALFAEKNGVSIPDGGKMLVGNKINGQSVIDPAATNGVNAEIQRMRQECIDGLIKSITSTIAPTSWRDSGGKVGSIRELNGQLIINQTQDNQLAIYNLLQQLREKAGIPAQPAALFGTGHDAPAAAPAPAPDTTRPAAAAPSVSDLIAQALALQNKSESQQARAIILQALQIDPQNEKARLVLAVIDASLAAEKTTPQILIKAVVAECTEPDLLKLFSGAIPDGVKLTSVDERGRPAAAAPAEDMTFSLGFTRELDDKEMNDTLRDLEAKDLIHILSRPSMIIRSRQEAMMESGSKIPGISGYRLQDPANPNSEWLPRITQTLEGLKLTMQPILAQDSFVRVHFECSAARLLRFEEKTAPETPPEKNLKTHIPLFDEQKIDTTVMIKVGHTIVIGATGLDRTQITGAPPATAPADAKSPASKKQLIVLLTPQLIAPPDTPSDEKK